MAELPGACAFLAAHVRAPGLGELNVRAIRLSMGFPDADAVRYYTAIFIARTMPSSWKYVDETTMAE